jgi:hypothetical protein
MQHGSTQSSDSCVKFRQDKPRLHDQLWGRVRVILLPRLSIMQVTDRAGTGSGNSKPEREELGLVRGLVPRGMNAPNVD